MSLKKRSRVIALLAASVRDLVDWLRSASTQRLSAEWNEETAETVLALPELLGVLRAAIQENWKLNRISEVPILLARALSIAVKKERGSHCFLI